MRALVVVRGLLVLAVGLVSACAVTPKTTMLVPSRTTTAELELLSRKAGTTVDALTVSGRERQLVLDGAGGDALTGRSVDAARDTEAAQQVVQLPFDELALVYYRANGLPYRDQYPELPRAGARERRLTCDELAVELARVETIRWFAREHGGTSFTQHEIRSKHAVKAGMITGLILASPLIIAFSPLALQNVGPIPRSPPGPKAVTPETYRWATRAADRRELGLLELKRAQHCAPLQLGTEAGSDLAVLERIESSVRELDAKQITEREQLDRQTRLLDELYRGPSPAAATVTAETGESGDRAAAERLQ